MSGIEMDVLKIPAGELRPGDEFYVKGQRFIVWEIEPLPVSGAAYLIRVTGETCNYRTAMVMDRRLLFEAVFRQVDTCHCKYQSGLCSHCAEKAIEAMNNEKGGE